VITLLVFGIALLLRERSSRQTSGPVTLTAKRFIGAGLARWCFITRYTFLNQLAMRFSAAFRVAVLCCTALACLAAASESAAGSSNNQEIGNTAREQLFSQMESTVAAGDLKLAQAVQKQLLRLSRKEHSHRRKLMQPDTIDVRFSASLSVYGFMIVLASIELAE
jgi:hypothetical protein